MRVYEDDGEPDDGFPSFPVNRWHVVAQALTSVADVLRAAAEAADEFGSLAAAQCNHMIQRNLFRDEVARDIEAITRGE